MDDIVRSSITVNVSIKLQEQPNWMDDTMHFMRRGDDIFIELIRANGNRFAITRISIDDFNELADLLVTTRK
jgi:hypothetical protein